MRYYTIILTRHGLEQHEFDTEDKRDEFLAGKDDTFDDFINVDVENEGPNCGSMDSYTPSVGCDL